MKIIIHGGFFSESATNQETKLAKQNALAAIAQKAYQYLQQHTALQTVVYATSLLEDDELFIEALCWRTVFNCCSVNICWPVMPKMAVSFSYCSLFMVDEDLVAIRKHWTIAQSNWVNSRDYYSVFFLYYSLR